MENMPSRDFEMNEEDSSSSRDESLKRLDRVCGMCNFI